MGANYFPKKAKIYEKLAFVAKRLKIFACIVFYIFSAININISVPLNLTPVLNSKGKRYYIAIDRFCCRCLILAKLPVGIELINCRVYSVFGVR